jgi:regulator of protease activity HflC (stomatin/prohibitin superfamily)
MDSSVTDFLPLIGYGVLAVLAIAIIFGSFRIVNQATVAVVTMFGKYRRVMRPGLNLLIPFVEQINRTVPIQNRTEQLQFKTITSDQAVVYFTATVIFTVSDHEPETVKTVAFKFIDEASFDIALLSAVEASVREYVATRKQSEVLGLRAEIVNHAKSTLDEQLSSWGYTVIDLQITELAFDKEVTDSMARIVAATNLKIAAEAEGQALLITRTKAAEAEGAAIRIAAENEATAARLRGEGLAAFRKALAQGFGESAEMLEEHGLDPALLAFSMWTETIRDAAKEGAGNTIFIDGNIASGEEALRRLQAFTVSKNEKPAPKKADPKK